MTDMPIQTSVPADTTDWTTRPTTTWLPSEPSGVPSPILGVAAGAIASLAVLMAIRARARGRERTRRERLQRAVLSAGERLAGAGLLAARPLAAHPAVAVDLTAGVVAELVSLLNRRAAARHTAARFRRSR
jgi:hypothetical protein